MMEIEVGEVEVTIRLSGGDVGAVYNNYIIGGIILELYAGA